MSILMLLTTLAEKMALLAAAALFAVLFPPLRVRVLGQLGDPAARSRDKAFGMLFGTALSVWGASLGLEVQGEDINVRAVGVMVAAILGGRKAGALAGLCSGIFAASNVEGDKQPWVLIASVVDGVIAGLVATRAPHYFRGHRAFFTAIGIQVFHMALIGLGLIFVGHAGRYLSAWPAHLIKLIVNAAGVTLFVEVARLVVQREAHTVALVEARAAAHASELESLRRRLEPHFLFNALNVLRATIRLDPTRARDLVSHLADLYRYLLTHQEDARLADEVNHAKSYLAIEAARMGADRLEVHVDVPDAVAHRLVPALLLQPLVENAVKHGIASRHGPGTVSIRAHAEGADLLIEVEDASDAPRREASAELKAQTASERPGSGLALKTLRQRLSHRYGPRAKIRLMPTERGMRAVVRLPPAPSEPSLRPSRSARGAPEPVHPDTNV